MPKRFKRGDDYDDEEDEGLGADAEEEALMDEEDEEEADDKPSKRRKSAFVDDYAEEDEDGEDDGDGRPAKRANPFIDDIALVDDDEEEEEDEEAEDLIDDREEEIPDTDMHNHRRLMRDRDEDTRSGFMAKFEEKWADGNVRQTDYDYMEEAEETAVTQQGLLPTIHDPKLWIVHCRPGREREACIQLLQKHYTFSDSERGPPLLIKSAVCLDHLKGYIYVESEKEAHVRDAIRGLRTIFSSKGATLVPLNEMVDAITVNKKAKAPLGRDSWVRIKSGLYKDDLAKIEDIDYAAEKATVRVVPRLDLQQLSAPKEERQKFPFGRTGAVRPPSRAFDDGVARQYRIPLSRDPEPGVLVFNSYRFKEGYLLKKIGLKSLIILSTPPSIEELQAFNSVGRAKREDTHEEGNSELEEIMKGLKTDSMGAPKATFAKGDKVMICKGELQSLVGVVQDIGADGKVFVLPELDGFSEAIDFEPDELRKHFKIGDHVKVLAGPHSGETGLVLQVQDAVCVIMSDTTKQELKVFARDLTDASDMSGSIETLGPYQLHDLVQLNATTAGVIFQIDKDAAKVLTVQGTPDHPDIKVCRIADIQRKVFSKKNTTGDAYNNQVQSNDFVSVIDGPAKGKGGKVEHVVRGCLFIRAERTLENGGFICVRARSCKLRGGKTTVSASTPYRNTPARFPQSPGPNNVLRSPGHSMYAPTSPRIDGNDSAGPSYNRNGPPPRNNFGKPPLQSNSFSGRSQHSRSMNTLVGQMVNVAQGAYRGYKGRVKQETDTHVQLELDAICRVVTVPKSMLKPQASGPDSRPFGGRPDIRPVTGTPSTPYHASRTPLHPSQTPLHPFSSATPLHPSMTPLHAQPTPLHHSAATPTDDNWSSDPHTVSAPTPLYNPSYTPGYNALTPAFTPADNAVSTPADIGGTPGIAHTPGMARTPYMDATTPAITPADMATTPGAFDAYTPATTATPGLAQTPGLGVFTPGVFTPAEPGYDPLSPGLESSYDYSQWEGVLVSIDNGGYAVVKQVQDSTWKVQLGTLEDDVFTPTGEEDYVVASDLKPVRPQKKDKVKILKDEHNTGKVGHLIGIDGTDGIVKCDGSHDIQIIDIAHLGKLVEGTA